MTELLLLSITNYLSILTTILTIIKVFIINNYIY